MSQTILYINAIIAITGLFGSFLLNEHIYNKKWFNNFAKVSILLIVLSFISSSIFGKNFYFNFIIVFSIQLYGIKATQLLMKYFFGQRYTVHIKGIDFRKDKNEDLNEMPSMSTLFSFCLMMFYGVAWLLFL